MKNLFVWVGIAAAFVSGFVMARNMPAAQAQTPKFTAQIINLLAMTDDEISPSDPSRPGRIRLLGASSEGTVSVQTGDVPKHYHVEADEIQYILDGAGTFWLGDTQHQVKAGDLIIIPRGVAHAGSKATTGRFKAMVVKIPPQRPGDTKLVD